MIKLWFGNGAWATKKARRRLSAMQPHDVRKIAVIRHAALGDMVLTRPFLKEIRRFFPNAVITLSLVSNYTRGAPEDLVDRVHVAHGSDKRKLSKKAQISRMRELGEQDIIFDLAATSRSFWICALNKAKIKVGFPYHVIQRYFFYDVVVLRSDLRFEAEAMLDMLNLMGFKTQYPLDFDLPGDTRQEAKPYVLYFTGASTAYKCWPKDSFHELVKTLSDEFVDSDHKILGGVADWESNDELLQALDGKQNVHGVEANSVEETISLVKGAQLVISNDTGIRHLAIAANVPSVGIFFATDPFITMPFRYWPKFGKHGIVFNADGHVPDVTQVLAEVRQVIQ